MARPITLDRRSEQCRTLRQRAAPLDVENDARLALSAYVGLQSRGMALFSLRQGQLNLSCAQCHDNLAGRRLAGSVIPRGHPNGYPEYRLEWQGMGSSMRRLRNCLVGVRAEPFAADSPELTNLDYFLAWRAQRLRVETPAVRP